MAIAEVGHTQVPPAVARAIVAVFLATLLAVPVIDQVQEARLRASLTLPAVRDFLTVLPETGAMARAKEEHGTIAASLEVNARFLRDLQAFEEGLRETSYTASLVVPVVQRVLIGHLGVGNEDVYPGREGWLFYRPGIDSLTGRGFLDPAVLRRRARGGSEWASPPQPDPVRAIAAFHQDLQERDIHLIVLPAPTKAAIYPGRFSARYDGMAPVHNPSFTEFLHRIEAAGVACCDVVPALMDAKTQRTEPLYLVTDTHWSPAGLDVVADTLVTFIEQRGWTTPGAPSTYHRVATAITNRGDMARTLGPAAPQEETVTIQRVVDRDGMPIEDARAAPVLLLGDSFANIYRLAGMGWGDAAGLPEQLAWRWQQPVDALVRNDGGAQATREALAKEESRLDGKRIVIWEFAERELAFGDWRLP